MRSKELSLSVKQAIIGWMTEKILSLVNKIPFTTDNTLQEVGVCVSNSTIKRRLHQSEYRGFATKCKTIGEPQKQDGQIRVCQTTSKIAFTVLENHPMDR